MVELVVLVVVVEVVVVIAVVVVVVALLLLLIILLLLLLLILLVGSTRFHVVESGVLTVDLWRSGFVAYEDTSTLSKVWWIVVSNGGNNGFCGRHDVFLPPLTQRSSREGRSDC